MRYVDFHRSEVQISFVQVSFGVHYGWLEGFEIFRVFEALWGNGAPKPVNNISLHCDKPSKLRLGQLENKKFSDIIKVSVGPKFSFVINIYEKIVKSYPLVRTGGRLGFATGGCGVSKILDLRGALGGMMCRNRLIISLYT